MFKIRSTMKHIKFNLGLTYNPISFEFHNGKGVTLSLTDTQGILLNAILNGRSGRISRREEIVSILWGEGYFDYSAALNQKVFSLKKRLKNIGLDRLIITVRGIGYKINPELIDPE